MQTPSVSSLAGFDSLTEIGFRHGVDVRQTLLQVLTDLYVQQVTHTSEEKRHYTELALRLLEAVDVQTRRAVAMRLAGHVSPPERVIHCLANDLPEVAAALGPHHKPQARGSVAKSPPWRAMAEAVTLGSAHQGGDGPSAPAGREKPTVTAATPPIRADVATELNEMFFAATASERRLILLNLDIVVGQSMESASIAYDPAVGRRLEAAALAHNREEFAQTLARSLRISREQAHLILRDELGEPIVVAAKMLNIPRDLVYWILLFVNKTVGHSVERVHALAELYDEMTRCAAAEMVAIWQALGQERSVGKLRALHENDANSTRGRPQSAERRDGHSANELSPQRVLNGRRINR
ncbi:MAG TPA: hypothetical protein VGJ20_34275 [Xanthobacteraceae bacterium]|jgi:hypothetical protein